MQLEIRQTVASPFYVKWHISMKGYCIRYCLNQTLLIYFFPVQISKQWVNDSRIGTTCLRNYSWQTCSESLQIAESTTPPRVNTTNVPIYWRNSSIQKLKKLDWLTSDTFFFLNNQTNQCAYFMGRGSHYISELWDYKVLKNFCLTISTFKNHFSFANMYYNEVTKIILLKCFIMYLITDFLCVPTTVCSSLPSQPQKNYKIREVALVWEYEENSQTMNVIAYLMQ